METVISTHSNPVCYPEHKLELLYKMHTIKIANPLLRELACVFCGFTRFKLCKILDSEIIKFFFSQIKES